jgi:hypothetical protein
MRHKQLVFVLAITAAVGALDLGCVARAQMGASADVQPVVFTERPTLVQVVSGVWVVRDYDDAVYYVDGSYWVFKDDVWYRSAAYDHGWATVKVSLVPGVIVHRDHHAYVHFHGDARAETRMAPDEHEGLEASRGGSDEAAEKHGGPPGHDETPGLGEQRHEDQQGANEAKKADKKEEKAERKEERADRREDNKADKKPDKKQDKQGKKDKDDKKK